MLDISFAGAAFAGLLSFFTPCILPMVPFYLCYMAGISMSELRDDAGITPGAQRRLILSSVFFAAGVTTIFVLLGMGATAVGRAFADWMDVLKYGAAALLLAKHTARSKDRVLVLTPDTDLTGKLRVPATRGRVHYRVVAEPLDGGPASAPLTGSFRAVPGRGEPVRIQWSGDVVGQGWGIDRATGGMRIFSAMADRDPDLFLHSGDTVYADGPLTETVTLPDGRVWRNEMTPEKAKVAETLTEFRGQFAYNLRDDNLRRFAASVGQIVQWDDHEVTNNWYPGEILTGEVGERYTEKRVDVLAARGFRAFHEWQPVDPRTAVDGRVYRRVPFGPHVEVFVLDMRTYRSANSANTGRGERILGEAQARWLVDALASSRATWKIVASDMPIGVLVPDGDTAWEAVANGVPGPPSGRESEIAGVLAGIRRRRVRNVVWVTADVHYTAAHHYAPERAAFTDFDPFWEFVSGPLHAGAFGPNELDPTFGAKKAA